MLSSSLRRLPADHDDGDGEQYVLLAAAVVERALSDLLHPRYAMRAAAFLLRRLWEPDCLWNAYLSAADPTRARAALAAYIENVLADRVRLGGTRARWPASARGRLRELARQAARRDELREQAARLEASEELIREAASPAGRNRGQARSRG